AGEILGVAGVDGNGQAELEAALAGLVAPESGSVRIDGTPLPAAMPSARRDLRLAYIPSDRYRHGLVGPLDLADNLDLGRTPGIRPARRRRRSSAVGRLVEWDVRGGGPTISAGDLSGGNAQKLVLSRELDEEPSAVIACHPTRGLDPGAAATVAERLVAFAASGAAVLWIGAELDELFNVCDRLVVLAGGEIADRCDRPFDRTRIGEAMASALPVAVASAAGDDIEVPA
ncbi:MAG: ATP-binding cassette domain-containing protein, partial [Actinomycetota bacterium]